MLYENDQLKNVVRIFKEFKDEFGLILILCYNESEIFTAYDLSDTLTKIKYDKSRRIPHDPVYTQGKTKLSIYNFFFPYIYVEIYYKT